MTRDLSHSLKQLKSVKPNNRFKRTLRQRLEIYEPQDESAPLWSIFATRMALAIFAFVVTGTTVGVGANQSQPGDTLYPVKEMVQEVAGTMGIGAPTTQVASEPVLATAEPETSPTVEPEPSASPSPSPTAEPPGQEDKEDRQPDKKDASVLGVASEKDAQKPKRKDSEMIPGNWDEQIKAWVFEKLNLKEEAKEHETKPQFEAQEAINKNINKKD